MYISMHQDLNEDPKEETQTKNVLKKSFTDSFGATTCMLYNVISLRNLLHDSLKALPIYLLTVLF